MFESQNFKNVSIPTMITATENCQGLLPAG